MNSTNPESAKLLLFKCADDYAIVWPLNMQNIQLACDYWQQFGEKLPKDGGGHYTMDDMICFEQQQNKAKALLQHWFANHPKSATVDALLKTAEETNWSLFNKLEERAKERKLYESAKVLLEHWITHKSKSEPVDTFLNGIKNTNKSLYEQLKICAIEKGLYNAD